MQTVANNSIETIFSNEIQEINAALKNSIEEACARSDALVPHAARLQEAMAYAVLGPGKRLRPLMSRFVARALANEMSDEQVWQACRPAAVALELLHAYSLVHDDLPAMDDDDFRRGKPSCHKQFGEATAILVGDALLTEGFRVLAAAPNNAALMVQALAGAAGAKGMVLGQLADLSQGNEASKATILAVHLEKTGRLYEAACAMGAMSVGASNEAVSNASSFGRHFGIAFQLLDDLNDGEGSVALCGRAVVTAWFAEAKEQAARALQGISYSEERLLSILNLLK